MSKKEKTANGAEKLIRKMADRAYGEAFDIPEEAVLDQDYIPEEDAIDHDKDTEVKGR